jgi:D-alanine-D-alanine ligase-like ATP-grasp enzyme
VSLSLVERRRASAVRLRRLYRRVKGALDFGARRRDAMVDALRHRFFEALWRETAAAIGASIEDVGYGFYRISRGPRSTFVRDSDVMLDDHLSLEIAGNKPLVHRLLAERGYPTPRFEEFTLATLDRAERFLGDLGRPVAVKPASGTGGGNGVTTNVMTRRALSRAAFVAETFCDNLIVEEQLPGDSYRLLFLDGQFLDAVRREPPTVIGDGKRTISKLIQAENEQRMSADPPTALSPITVDQDCRAKLRIQGLSLDSVPRVGEVVIVKQVVNQNSARENHVVRETVHPSVVKLGQLVVAVLGLRFAGLDLLTSDIAAPSPATGGVIAEINTTPGLHHHVLVAEREQRAPVAAVVLDHVLSDACGSARKSQVERAGVGRLPVSITTRDMPTDGPSTRPGWPGERHRDRPQPGPHGHPGSRGGGRGLSCLSLAVLCWSLSHRRAPRPGGVLDASPS